MIVKSFLRRKTSIIYLFMLSILISILLLLNSSYSYLNTYINDIYSSQTIFFVKNKENLKDELEKYNGLKNVKRSVLLSNIDDDVLKVKKGNDIFDLNINNIGLDGLMFFQDDNLLNSELIIGLDSTTYKNIENNLNSYIGGKIKLYHKEKEFEFVIKDIYNSNNFNDFRISRELFSVLRAAEENFVYIAQLKNKGIEDDCENYFNKFKKNENDYAETIHIYDKAKEHLINSLEKNFKYINYGVIIMTIIFLVILLVIYKNILEENVLNCYLEKMIGFKNIDIKINLLKKYFVLIVLSSIIGLIFANTINLFINEILEFRFMLEYKYFIKIIILLLFSNLLLVGTINNKLNLAKIR